MCTAIFYWTHLGGRYACLSRLNAASKQINLRLKIVALGGANGQREFVNVEGIDQLIAVQIAQNGAVLE